MNELARGRAEDWLAEQTERARCIFMDPPDNIGLEYASYRDRIPADRYYAWLRGLIAGAMRAADTIWVSHHAKHLAHVASAILGLTDGDCLTGEQRSVWSYRTVVWRYTFGQYRDDDLGWGFRPIAMLRRRGSAPWNWDAIREESGRMRAGDARVPAGPDGKPRARVPDDVWDFPRVTGNSPERRGWHPTQHPVILVDRIMKLSTPPSPSSDGAFVDLFAGSGTCFRASYLNPGVRVIGVESDPAYCEKIAAEHPNILTRVILTKISK